MVEMLEVSIHPIINPKEIIIKGKIFIEVGRINRELVVIMENHEIALPAVTDIIDRRVIGMMIALYS